MRKLLTLLAVAFGAAIFCGPREPVAPVEIPLPVLEEEADVVLPEEPPAPQPLETGEPRFTPTAPRTTVKAVPTAQVLYVQTTKLEALLRKRARPGDDVDQALFVLNKQRLRLTGNPSLEDRREVARQLAGWRRSYLRR